ncbi:ADP-heptose--LPS heptosyltransferase [Pasteurellaceae bacterium Macca]|nr:ADP-heptose--LPS heptosyltransferase [Pasteurellaceae bacterium Macca]
MNLKKLMITICEKRDKLTEKDVNLKEIKSILLRPLGDAIGDATIHTAHLLQLKSIFPQATLGVVVTSQNKIIFEHSNLVDKYIHRNFFDYIKNHKKWDLLLDFENNFTSASLFMDRILMPKYIAIFKKYNKKHYNFNTIFNYNFHFPQKDNKRLSHYLCHSFFNNNNQLIPPYSHLTTDPKTDLKIEYFWEEKKYRLLLCPQGSKRQIPPQELGELLTHCIDIIQSHHIDIILSYTQTAEEYLKQLLMLYPYLKVKISPKTSLTEYLSLIASANFVIAVDGGSLHLACAFRKPLLSFFANSQPNLGTWEPLVYPNIPHFKVITKKNVGENSNLTQDFQLDSAKLWLKTYLNEQINKE